MSIVNTTPFAKELREYQKSLGKQSAADTSSIKMLRCIRWAMKTHGMNIEIKRADSLLSLQLVKYDMNKQLVDMGFSISVTDNNMEKGFFELEHEIMQFAGLEPLEGLERMLTYLRKGKLNLPSHNDLRNEIMMGGQLIRISYLGTESNGKDYFGGFLISRDRIVLQTEPQNRMGYVLDDLENAVFEKRRENYRKSIADFMHKLYTASASDDDDVFE